MDQIEIFKKINALKLQNQKCRQMIKQGFISLVSDDSSAYPQVQVSYNGKPVRAVRFSPYGLCSNPPKGSVAMLLGPGAQESRTFALLDDMPNRFKNLKEYETALYNYKTKSYVLMKEDGSIDIDSKKDLNLNIDGDVNAIIKGNLSTKVTGTADIESTGNMTLKAPAIELIGAIKLTGAVTGSAGGNSIDAPSGLKTGSLDWETHGHEQGNDGDNDSEVKTDGPS